MQIGRARLELLGSSASALSAQRTVATVTGESRGTHLRHATGPLVYLAPAAPSQLGAMMSTPTPETVEQAKTLVRDFIRSVAPQSLIDEQALRIVGEPPARAEQLLAELRNEIADNMAACNPATSRSKIFAMPLAFCELVRERARELEHARGRG